MEVLSCTFYYNFRLAEECYSLYQGICHIEIR